MSYDYFNLPFGGQLLVWTSRMLVYGSCRSKPNKYALIDLAFDKVGISEGSMLLKPLVKLLREKNNFKIQPMCERILIEDEVNLINCIEDFQYNANQKNEFIKIWNLEESRESFLLYATKLAKAFKDANLNTNLNFNEVRFNKFKNNNLNFETRH